MIDSVFYDKSGKAVAYVKQNDIYSFGGKPIAYIDKDIYVYLFSGKHVGWVENGWIIDLSGNYVLFSDGASGGPTRPLKQILPIRSIRSIKPIKGIKEIHRVKPIKSNNWSRYTVDEFFGIK